MKNNDQYHCVVQKVILDGRHGPYAVATSEQLKSSVTFSLSLEVWKSKKFPERGTWVVLSDITKKRAGWRAGVGRFLEPADEQQQPEEKSKGEE